MSDDEREKQCEKPQSSSVGRIGGGDDVVSSHDLYQLKALDYRYDNSMNYVLREENCLSFSFNQNK